MAGFAKQVVLHEAEPSLGRQVDLSEVGLEVVPARLGALVHQEFAVADDVIYRSAQFVAKLVKVRSGVGECSVVEVLAHEDQQLLAAITDRKSTRLNSSHLGI